MKKTLGVLTLAAAASLCLAGCGTAPGSSGSQGADTAKKSDFKACIVSDSGGFNDKSFNQSAKEGLEKAAKEIGFDFKETQSKSDSDYVPNIAAMVQDKCKLIVGVGFLMSNAMGEAAKANPGVNFALVDSPLTISDKPVDLPNGKALVFNTAEAGYLAGYVAASQSKTGKVGTFLGVKLPTTAIFADGFSDGIAAYNKAKGKDVKLVGWDKEKQDGLAANSFTDASKGKIVADQLISQGADIILPVAGGAGIGALQAAKAADEAGKNVSVIWVDSDGYVTNPDYKSVILTSVMKLIANAVYDTAKGAFDGKFDSKAYIGTLANHGVGLGDFHDFASKVSEETKKEVAEIQKKIESGELKVETKNAPK